MWRWTPARSAIALIVVRNGPCSECGASAASAIRCRVSCWRSARFLSSYLRAIPATSLHMGVLRSCHRCTHVFDDLTPVADVCIIAAQYRALILTALPFLRRPGMTSLDIEPPATALDGRVVLPGDPTWDADRQPWNLAVDQQPAMVAIAASGRAVARVVRFARRRRLRVVVQGTGHNAASLGPLDGIVLLRTSEMRGVRIDAAHRRAHVRPGALWMDVTKPASDLGLAALSGSSPDVGVVGYTLGGGLSWLGRRYGLAANSVRGIEVVPADGGARVVAREREPDLFWALRGGGGGFGAVTGLEFALYRAPRVYAGALMWPWERSREVLQRWREWSRTAPAEFTTSARIMQFPPIPELPDSVRGRALVVIDGAFLGDEAAGAHRIAPLRALGPETDTFAMQSPAML